MFQTLYLMFFCAGVVFFILEMLFTDLVFMGIGLVLLVASVGSLFFDPSLLLPY